MEFGPPKEWQASPPPRMAGLLPGPTSTVESTACFAGGVLTGRIRGLYSLGNGRLRSRGGGSGVHVGPPSGFGAQLLVANTPLGTIARAH